MTDGFQAIAKAEHLAGGGTIGGNGVDPASAFAQAVNGNVQLNPDLPAGYPLLDQALETTGLTVGDQVISDQIAALGAGRDPQQLDQTGPQLIFISSGDTDANGSGFNFDGEAIAATELDLPGDRTLQTDNGGTASLATPLAADSRSTVGIQFAGTGPTVAIIHHTGMGSLAGESTAQTDHFEVVRGDTYSLVRWRDAGRVAAVDGQLLELEDLNERPELRNELFTLIGREVNNLVPAETHTVCGPAVTELDLAFTRQLRRTPGRLVRMGDTVNRRVVKTRNVHRLVSGGPWQVRSLRPGGGRLVRDARPAPSRRHLGRVSTRK